jgi:hypothetical protein
MAIDFTVRVSPRLVIDEPISAHVVTLGTMVSVRDLSAGGVSTTSPVPVEPGALHTFDLVLEGRISLRLDARSIHCRRDSGRDTFTIGWAWATDAVTAQNVQALLDHVTDVGHMVKSEPEPPTSSGLH